MTMQVPRMAVKSAVQLPLREFLASSVRSTGLTGCTLDRPHHLRMVEHTVVVPPRLRLAAHSVVDSSRVSGW